MMLYPAAQLVSRAQRATKWCAAEPGPSFLGTKITGVPDQRCIVPLRFTLHRVRDTSSAA
jgi:hypothetical protein